MDDGNLADSEVLLDRIQRQMEEGSLRLTLHAQQEMVDENVKVDDIYDAIATGQVLENYPQHRRGACCLLCGHTHQGRFLHIVCTTANSKLIVITVYEPRPPKWITPTYRGGTR